MSNIRGVSILGGTVNASISGGAVSIADISSDAITKLKNIRADEITIRDGRSTFTVQDIVNNAVLQELLLEIKDLNKTIKIIHNMEI